MMYGSWLVPLARDFRRGDQLRQPLDADGRMTPAAAGHIASNATWPICGASAGYPARKNPTILRERNVCLFIWILLLRGGV